MVGVAPPRQVPNSAGKSVDIEDSSDDNHSFDNLYSSSDENEVCYILARYCDTYVDYLMIREITLRWLLPDKPTLI